MADTKASLRKDIRRNLGFLKNCEFQAQFWFDARHSWTAGNELTAEEGYKDCRRKYLKNRDAVNFFRKNIARLTARYVALYA